MMTGISEVKSVREKEKGQKPEKNEFGRKKFSNNPRRNMKRRTICILRASACKCGNIASITSHLIN